MIKIKLDKGVRAYIDAKANIIPKNTHGIYFLKFNDIVVYVGKSVNLKSRVSSHCSEGIKAFNDFSFIECPLELMDSTEIAYIIMYDPIFNKRDCLTKGETLSSFCAKNLPDAELYEESSLLPSVSYFKNETDAMSLFKSYEIAVFFGIPKPTAANWSKAKDWRGDFYKKLEKIYAQHLAELAKGM